MTQANESRPAGNEAAIKKQLVGAASENHSTAPTDITTPSNAKDVLQEWPRNRWDDYLLGHRHGYVEGIARGRELADEEASALHREASRVVLEMARLPEVDRDETAARRARIDARFADERGRDVAQR